MGHHRAIMIPLLLTTVLVTACGYRFPGEHTRLVGNYHVDGVKVGGRGAQDNPVLARELQDHLVLSLGVAGGEESAAVQPQQRVRLQLEMMPVRRILQAETSRGRAEQYRVLVEARPVVYRDGQALTEYPLVKGESTYYEQRTGTENQAIRLQAEREAMEQMADNLTALMKEDP